jgi:NADP-dependent 3-hydroxy acid dehydrogenase YdfG
MLKPLSQRVAVITGASSGIGEATALALAFAGVKVVVTARRSDRLDDLVRRIAESGGVAHSLPGDVIDEEFATGIIAQAVERFGGIDILVNSAGVIQAGGVENCDTEQWRRTMNLNFFASLYTSRAAIPFMKQAGGGDIVQISSTGGRRPTAHFASYGASKFALNGMSWGLREEVGMSGIRVCVIEPGATTSEIAEGMTDSQGQEFMRRHVTKEGAMKAEDIATVILCVVSLPERANVQEVLIRPTIDVAPL